MGLILLLTPLLILGEDDKSMEEEIDRMLQEEKPSSQTAQQGGRYFQDFNPDMSLIVDTFFQRDTSREGIAHVFEQISGFGHECTEDHHHGPDKGFNMNHLELYFSANADPYFKGWGIAAIEEEGAEMEEAVIQTTALPYGLQIKAGKFFSDIGRINPQHSHSWDFSDQPLVYRLTLGPHGLNDKGIQASWLAPTNFYLLAGAEAFQGNNETMFNYIGDEDGLPIKAGPRIFTGWLKFAPNITNPNHALQFGVFSGKGVHQEEHDGNSNDVLDHWLSGYSRFYGADFVYKYDDLRAYGRGDIIVQGEYFQREKDLTVENINSVDNPALTAALIGKHKMEKQDGYYLQATYGLFERWRLGLRWEQIGLVNEIDLPNGTSELPDASSRTSLMTDWTLTEFSRLRVQFNRGNYERDGADEWVNEFYIQLQISLGTHGAHKF
jgi:hypothetical protein